MVSKLAPRSYYSPDDDLAFLHVRESADVRAQPRDWGLVIRDAESGEVAGIELWSASKLLPPELLEHLPKVDRGETVITSEDLAKRQPA